MPDEQDPSRDPTTGKFLPGHSGNPEGRKPGRSFREALEHLLKEIPEGWSEDGRTRAEIFAALFLDEVIKRKPYAIREFLKREWPEKLFLDLSGGFELSATVGMTDEPDKLAALMDVLAEAGVAAPSDSSNEEEAG